MLVAIKTIIIDIIIIVFDSKLTSFIFSKWGLDYLLIKIIIVGTVIIVRQIVNKLTILFSANGVETRALTTSPRPCFAPFTDQDTGQNR